VKYGSILEEEAERKNTDLNELVVRELWWNLFHKEVKS
jgi:hypothetical protein